MNDDALLISSYLAVSVLVTQFTHSYYVGNDPEYEGRLRVCLSLTRPRGFSLSLRSPYEVSHRCGYVAAGILSALSLGLMLSVFEFVLPELDAVTCTHFVEKQRQPIIFALSVGGIAAAPYLVGAAAMKTVLNLAAGAMAWVMLYAGTSDAATGNIAVAVASIIGGVIALAVAWLGVFQPIRLRRFRRKQLFIDAVFYNPPTFVTTSVAWTLGMGLLFIVLIHA